MKLLSSRNTAKKGLPQEKKKDLLFYIELKASPNILTPVSLFETSWCGRRDWDRQKKIRLAMSMYTRHHPIAVTKHVETLKRSNQ